MSEQGKDRIAKAVIGIPLAVVVLFLVWAYCNWWLNYTLAAACTHACFGVLCVLLWAMDRLGL